MDLLGEYGKGISEPYTYKSIYDILSANAGDTECSPEALRTVTSLVKSLEESRIPADQAREVVSRFCKHMVR